MKTQQGTKKFPATSLGVLLFISLSCMYAFWQIQEPIYTSSAVGPVVKFSVEKTSASFLSLEEVPIKNDTNVSPADFHKAIREIASNSMADPQVTINALRELEERYRGLSEDNVEWAACIAGSADAMYLVGEYGSAIEAYGESRDIIGPNGSIAWYALSWIREANAARRLAVDTYDDSQLKVAIKLLTRAETLVSTSGHDSILLSRIYSQRAWTQMASGNTAAAFKDFESALAVDEDDNFHLRHGRLVAKFYDLLRVGVEKADLLVVIEQFEKLEEKLQAAAIESEESSLLVRLANTRERIGDSYMMIAEPDRAITKYQLVAADTENISPTVRARISWKIPIAFEKAERPQVQISQAKDQAKILTEELFGDDRATNRSHRLPPEVQELSTFVLVGDRPDERSLSYFNREFFRQSNAS